MSKVSRAKGRFESVSSDYGGFGVVMAIFFWIGFGSTIIVIAASLSPALAVRREARSA